MTMAVSRPNEGLLADLHDMHTCLTSLLPPLLLGRFDDDVLQRWARLRCWVASAQEGDWVLPLATMHLAVENLAAVVDQRYGGHWADTSHVGGSKYR